MEVTRTKGTVICPIPLSDLLGCIAESVRRSANSRTSPKHRRAFLGTNVFSGARWILSGQWGTAAVACPPAGSLV